MENKYRLTLLNPYVWDNFWMHIETDFDKSKTLKEQYDEFVESNKTIIEKINEMLDSGQYDMIKEEYGYNDFGTAQAHGFQKTSNGIKTVSNLGYNSKSMNDIHYCVRAIYRKLVKNEKNYDVYTPFSLLDTEAVEEMDALFAFLDVPNIDLSTWDVSNVVNMEGMFYKSTFNNDSIRNWDVSNVTNMRNMFIGSDMTNEDYISNWYPNTINHALPKIGIDTTKDMLDTDAAVDRMFGTSDDIEKNVKRRKQIWNESYHIMSSNEFIEKL